jgi:LPXTG-site transpeptidase (sortase) family protein
MINFKNKSSFLEKIFLGITILGVTFGLVVGVAQPRSTVQAVTNTDLSQSGIRIFADFTDPCGSDSYEPDNIYSQASLITTDGTQQSRTNALATDIDWIRFNAISGHTYQIRTILTNEINQSDNLANDTYLYLYDTNGTTQLTSNDDVGNTTWYLGAYFYRESIITWTAPSTAQYYVQEKQWNPSARPCHTYNFWVTDLTTTPQNQLSIIKSASLTFFTAAGQSIIYTYRITNTGINDLTSPTVTDNKFIPATVSCGTSPLYHGFTASCTRTYTTTAADVTAGSVTNTATASGVFGGTTYTSNSVSTTINLASLNLVKSANPTFFTGPGQNINYTYTLTNTGTVVLASPYTITDDKVLPVNINCAGATSPLNPGESTTCTGTYTTTPADVTAGFVTNTASATADYGLFTIPSNSASATINLNQAPTAIALNPSSVAENQPINTVVGTLSTTDPDALDTFTYTLVPGAGSTDNASFNILGNSLRTSAVFDYETKNSYSIRVRSTDSGGLFFEQQFTITVTNVNEAPTINPQFFSVAENSPNGTIVGTVLATDPDTGDTLTFAITAGNTGSTFAINPISGQITVANNTLLDFGTNPSFSLTIQATDTGFLSSSATVTIAVTDILPDISVTKTAGTLTVPETGGPITYTYTVTNNSTEAATITALSDDQFGLLAGDSDCQVSTILAGSANCSFDATFSVPAGDFPGTHVNVFSASVTDGDGNNDTATDDATVTYTDVLPSVSLDKSVDIATLPEPGGTFTFTLAITNNSPEAAIITALTDTNTLSPACNALVGSSLGAGFTTSCTYTVNHTEPGIYNNTASVTVTDNEGNPATDTDSESISVTNIAPAVTLVKTVTPASRPEPGGFFDYTLTITNNSVEIITITALTDTNTLSTECTDLIGDSLAVGAGTSCNYSVSHTDAGSFPNTASVTVTDNEGSSASVSDSQSVSVTDVLPIVVLTKSAAPTSLPIPGGDFIFTLEIANNGLEEFVITGFTDSNSTSTDFSDCSALIGDTLAADSSVSCTYTVNHTDIGTYTNTANVTVEDNEGNSTDDTDSETVEVTDVIADLAITKSDSADPVGVNQLITYTLEVSNLGADAAINVSVVDDLPSEVIYITSSGTGWACNYDVPTHSVTCTRGNLAVGAAPEITITVTAPSSPATLQNTATVSALSSDPDPDNNSDSENTLITQSDPDALVKTLEDTSEDFTTGSNVAIGEVLTYEIVITIPPGTFDAAQLVDTLGQGLAFVACDSIDANPGLTTDITGGFPAVCNGAVVSEYAPGSIEPVDQGRQVSYDFGTLMNTTTDNTSLTVTYRAVVLDAIENQDGDTLTNSVQFSWDDGQSLPSANAGPVTIVEPDLSIQKTSNVTFVRVGDTVTFTITIRHTSESNADAFDVVIMDALPPGLQLLPASLVCSVGTSQLADADCTPSGNLIRAEWSEFLDNGISGVVRFQANVLSVPDLGGITNTSSVMWTSLPDDPGQISQYNALSTERTYDPGASSSITLNALTLGSALPATGFAPGVVTDISGLPQTLYSKNRDLTLEIPALKVDLPIVGVPLQNGNWDLTWLWKQAGWLEGSTYPSSEGNSVVTAHVYLPNGQPGPFIDIGTLSWGQELAVVSNSLRYIYQVREVSMIKPDDTSVFKHEDKPWLTLLTCKDYDEKTNSYRSRLMVRAVLMRIEDLTE